MPFITFTKEKITVEAVPGLTLLEAARSAGVIIESPCNAMGTCGKCTVTIKGCEEPALACQTIVADNMTVETRDYKAENASMKILSEGNTFEYALKPTIYKKLNYEKGRYKTEVYGGNVLIGVEEGDTLNKQYGIALDIGTTTMVAALIDLQTGGKLSIKSEINPQTAFAQDVLSRIHFGSTEEGLHILFQAFLSCLNGIIEELCAETQIHKETIYEIVFSGNTTMLHLATKTNPYPLGQYPYVSAIKGGIFLKSRELGIAIAPFGLVYLPPVISAYVGADITSGILVSRLDKPQGKVLFIDIGTNGEMALAADGKIAVSSTAAGPAFEGMNISCGMRASNGAIEAFAIEEEGSVAIKVIGGGKNSGALGICGSGLLDIAGELVKKGLIGSNGRFLPPENAPYPEALKKRMKEKEGKKAFFITEHIYLAQKDIRQIQLAKSAIRTGIEALLRHFNLSVQDVTKVAIAGSFGYHLREESLINIGLLPGEFAGKVIFIGNTSLSGAAAFLLNADFMGKMERLVTAIHTVELVKNENFEKEFIKYMAF
jgi:uncharacterized 2Fe-2S/4Fe-4S cluster protein (DUF4445 family)